MIRPRDVSSDGHAGPLNSAAFSPDGTRVVTTSEDRTACIWDAVSGRKVASLRGHYGSVRSATFSPNGTRVVTASSDGTARVWDGATGCEIASLKEHYKTVISAAFDRDGTRVVTASHDWTARVWNVSSIPPGNILQVACAYVRVHEDPIRLDNVTGYPLTFDRPICVTDPPPPDLAGAPEQTSAGR